MCLHLARADFSLGVLLGFLFALQSTQIPVGIEKKMRFPAVKTVCELCNEHNCFKFFQVDNGKTRSNG